MSEASSLEILMLELVNAERVALGLNPLVFDPDLNSSAELHSQWMLAADTFSHTGEGGSSATERMTGAGYELSGFWATGENVGYQSTTQPSGLEDEVRAIHEGLMNSPAHYANIAGENYEHIGIGIELGSFTNASGNTFEAVMITQNFGATGAVRPGDGTEPPVAPQPDPPDAPDPRIALVEDALVLGDVFDFRDMDGGMIKAVLVDHSAPGRGATPSQSALDGLADTAAGLADDGLLIVTTGYHDMG